MRPSVVIRSFAVIPAAGKSARMGAHKLLLPLGGRAVIDHVLDAWTASAVMRTVVIVRHDDDRLIDHCRRFGVDVLTAIEPPADMKASIQVGVSHLQARYRPADDEPWLVAPADSPRLSAVLIDALLTAYDPATPMALAPTFQGRRGHPLLMPWSYSSQVSQLAPRDGFDRVLESAPVCELPWRDSSILDDFNRPSEYARLVNDATVQSAIAADQPKEVIDAA